ncbi:MAG: AAA family ATPase [Sphingopyxis sp.]
MLIGHEQQDAAFADALRSGRMPHAWLLAGPAGVGKASFARRVATSLSGTQGDFHWLKREVPETKRPKDGSEGKAEDIARTITIGQVRTLLARLRMLASPASTRTVVIDSIDDMERGAANALLKTLEEPPARTIFLLVSHQPGCLLPTIRSRCRMLRFHPLDDDAPVDDVAIAQPLDDIVRTGDVSNRLRSEIVRTIAGAGASERLEALLAQANAIAVRHARSASGDALLAALDAHSRLSALSREAKAPSADNATIAFAVGSALASLAGDGAAG